MAKEQAKIMMARNANEERRIRYLNAPQRLIGLNSEALDAQVAGIRQNRLDQKEADRMEKLRNNNIQLILEEAMEEEKYMKKQQMDEMKQSWQESKEEKASRRPESMAIDRGNCGMSSAQNFRGEDLSRHEKERMKQEEMKQWVREKMYDRSNQKIMDKEDDDDYARLLKTIDGIRGAAEKEELDMRNYMNHSVRDENKALAEEHKSRYGKEITPVDMSTSLKMYNEDVHAAMDENGHIVRKDMFKGFTPAQKRRIMQENEMILMQKKEKEEEDMRTEQAYARQQTLIGRALEDAHQEELEMRNADKMHHMAVLRSQAEEIAMKKMLYKQSQGAVADQSGFYEGFGKSCR